MPFKSSFFLALAFVAAQAYAATIKIFANSAFDKADPFEFQPNELTARVGDILEFHFTGPGLGVLGSNHSVAMGVFTDPCTPAPGGFFSGWHPVNGTSKEADQIFRVTVNNTDPMVFYCPTGQHCSRGMHGVVNGAGGKTLGSYRASITSYRNAVAPTRIGGGELVNNTVANIRSDKLGAAPASSRASLMSVVAALSFALWVM